MDRLFCTVVHQLANYSAHDHPPRKEYEGIFKTLGQSSLIYKSLQYPSDQQILKIFNQNIGGINLPTCALNDAMSIVYPIPIPTFNSVAY